MVALPFAVLELTGSATDVGLVVAARSVPQVVFLLVGGIWADRIPRHLLMVGTNVVSALSQAASASVLLAHVGGIGTIAALQAVGGAATAFFFPASSGIVPQTVSTERLQEANALLRLALNGSQMAGAAVAGLVVAGIGPGWALVVDAASFAVSALFLARMHLPRLERLERSNFLRDLALGWNEFRSRTWLWVVVVAFCFINAMEVGAINVLGPVVAKRSLGGAGAWGAILAAQSIGLIFAGFLMLRLRPRRFLLVGCLGILFSTPLFALLALAAPVPLIACSALVTGIGVETFSVMWDTSMQQQIPQDRLSRLYSYDALGSFAFIPIGAAVAGPVAAAVGLHHALWLAGGVVLAATLAMLAVPSVRGLERRDGAAAPAGTAEAAAEA
jgi:MFS family permease